MKKVNLLSTAKAVLTFIIFAGILTACSNSTSSEEDEHEPVGFVIYQGSDQVISKNLNDNTTASLSISANASIQYRVAFLDLEGDVFTPEKDEHSLRFETTDGTGSISVRQENSGEPFLFTLSGNNAGEASFSFELLHVGSAEFGPATVSVTITSSN
ncbi:hypothetical protein [Gracilimonas sp.]|uniref:hypothetical protein n=1 Tax=Gracilimonas sp. TaxID=1974203 RepID=UPI0032EA9D4F